ncbi:MULTISPECIES: stage III sporulation protein AC [Alicyclobacillus]|uniref:Stage III sporulation protein AC n=1 Tax=Alicyclobacillus macrosporangiidus TaxID=392015 RepID=A0A1I7JXH3_9BACL|nr:MULTISPECIES: stage III sporulation protein AC [Alicyclobacillus]MCL6516189.1 stage III sporulation protein AC [Alicyclobacillus sp.]MCL6598447.1 stage III sporulation protein AC [Alicyclobacillus macrosporangiidus]SFU89844.1 stage III sporulation protein AC [Alicyclobacillus macrosporangiidus]
MTPEIRAILQIAGIGFLVAFLHSLLKESGKENYAYWTTVVGLVVVFMMVIGYVGNLYREIETVFLRQ